MARLSKMEDKQKMSAAAACQPAKVLKVNQVKWTCYISFGWMAKPVTIHALLKFVTSECFLKVECK